LKKTVTATIYKGVKLGLKKASAKFLGLLAGTCPLDFKRFGRAYLQNNYPDSSTNCLYTLRAGRIILRRKKRKIFL